MVVEQLRTVVNNTLAFMACSQSEALRREVAVKMHGIDFADTYMFRASCPVCWSFSYKFMLEHTCSRSILLHSRSTKSRLLYIG